MLLTCLFLGILPIALETGRYKRIRDPVAKTFRSLRVEEHLCNMCDLSETEDEIHFLFSLLSTCYINFKRHFLNYIKSKVGINAAIQYIVKTRTNIDFNLSTDLPISR